MIKEPQPARIGGTPDPLGRLTISNARLQRSARVVVRQGERVPSPGEHDPQDVGGWRRRVRPRAVRQTDHVQHPQSSIQDRNHNSLPAPILQVRQHRSGNPGRPGDRRSRRGECGATAKLGSGDNPAGCGRPNSDYPLDVVDVCGGQSRETADTADQLVLQVDGVAPRPSCPDQDGDDLSIAQCVAAEAPQPLPGTLTYRQVGDSQRLLPHPTRLWRRAVMSDENDPALWITRPLTDRGPVGEAARVVAADVGGSNIPDPTAPLQVAWATWSITPQGTRSVTAGSVRS